MSNQISVSKLVAPEGWKFVLNNDGDKLLGMPRNDGIKPRIYAAPLFVLISGLPYDPSVNTGIDGFIVERMTHAEIIEGLKNKLFEKEILMNSALALEASRKDECEKLKSKMKEFETELITRNQEISKLKQQLKSRYKNENI